MAGRNRKGAADYFSHDADASSDEKIMYLESKFGHTGYALYFKLLERMTRADNFELCWDEIKVSIYASEFGISVTEIEKFIKECCRKEIKAFVLRGCKLYSPGLKNRMQPLIEKREYNRKKYDEKISNKNSKLPISVTEIPLKVTEKTQRKGKERKGKKRKENIYSDKLKTFVGSYIKYISETFGARAPKTENLFENSCEIISMLTRIDGFEEDYIFEVLRWSQKDDFWRDQVFSLAGLRVKKPNGLKKFQNIVTSYEKDKGKTTQQDEIKTVVFEVAEDDR